MIDRVRLASIISDKHYRRTSKETKAAYAHRVASIMFRG